MNHRRVALVAIVFTLVMLPPLSAQSPRDRIAAVGPALLNGRGGEAKIELSKALAEFQAAKNPHGEGATLLLLGVAEMSLEQIGPARTYLEKAEATLRGKDAFGTWMVLLVKAQFEKVTGTSKASLASMEQAITTLSSAKTSKEPLTLETFMIFASAFSPEQVQTLSVLESQSEVLGPMLLEYMAEPLTHDLYGSLLIEAGQLDRAEKELDAAAVGAQFSNGALDSPLAAHFGDLRYRQRRYDDARPQYLKALEGSLQSPLSLLGEEAARLAIYDRLTDLEKRTNHLDEALRWNGKSLESASVSKNASLKCDRLRARGLLLMRRDRFPEAVAALEQALSLAVANSLVSQQAAVEGGLGSVHVLSGNYGAAVTHLESSIHLYQGLNEPLSEIVAWGTLSNVQLLTATHDAAADALKHARDLADKNQFPLGKDMIAAGEIWLHFRQGTANANDVRASLERFANNPQLASLEAGDEVARDARGIMRILEAGSSEAPLTRSGNIPLLLTYAYSMVETPDSMAPPGTGKPQS
jgi:tetratricopeptide (TPR) repeat protein